MLEELDGLPGEGLVRRGLTDLAAGRLSAEALTLGIASFRLRRLGIDLPGAASLPPDRELALYTALRTRAGHDAFARYNALRRELDSFLEALETRRRRAGG
jgi:hypothetical protein